MMVILPTLALAAWAILATIEVTMRDGYGRVPTRYVY
jgi:uncharacterized membrane protein